MSLLIETRRELEKVRQELDELTAKRDSEAVPYAMLFLIPRQLAHILCAAHKNPVVSRDEIMAIIAHTGRTGWGQSIKVVDVAVWRLNKRLYRRLFRRRVVTRRLRWRRWRRRRRRRRRRDGRSACRLGWLRRARLFGRERLYWSYFRRRWSS